MRRHIDCVSSWTWCRPLPSPIRFMCLSFGLAIFVVTPPTITAGQTRTLNLPAYRMVEGWAQVPAALKLGVMSAVQVGPDNAVYALHRCGGDSCAASTDPPILKFDRSGKLLKSWGGG